MQNLQKMTTTLLDPNIQSQNELYNFTEQISSGLPGLQGNALMLLKTGIPTPSAGIVFPGALREQMRTQFYFDVAPGKRFIRHVRPGVEAQETIADAGFTDEGPVYRMWISRLPIPHKHQVFDRLGL